MATQPSSPEPRYQTWEDFLATTTESERHAWCVLKAKVANRLRLLSGEPPLKVTTASVLMILLASEGRCRYCRSLAVERRPSDPVTGAPRPWEAIGRRIGSLNHYVPLVLGGTNVLDNLGWSCLWCNTWVRERRPGAVDHGGIQLVSP
jgi:hypothetical protein